MQEQTINEVDLHTGFVVEMDHFRNVTSRPNSTLIGGKSFWRGLGRVKVCMQHLLFNEEAGHDLQRNNLVPSRRRTMI